MKLLLLSSHAILEYDDVRLFSDLGIDVFCPGGYADPHNPSNGSEYPDDPAIRPAIPTAPRFPDLMALCHEQRVKHADQPTDFGVVDWAKADLHPDLIAWADVIMVNCFPESWIANQWAAIRHKRVIWRTIGQSNAYLEHHMTQFRRMGLEVVRYSPAERLAFEPTGNFAGEDAVIRFAKYPADFDPWIGDDRVVGNITQNLDTRGEHCGLPFWQAATKGLPVKLAGLGSQRMGGLGRLSYPDLLDYLRHLRVFLYLGTQPASYTLGLMEAMLAGVPIVSIGPKGLFMPRLFEGHELVGWGFDDPAKAREWLDRYLRDGDLARTDSPLVRARGVALFGAEAIGAQWCALLGIPVRQAVTV